MKMNKIVKSIIIGAVIFVITVSAIYLLHEYGIYERGYPAVGGEILLPVLPIIGLAIFSDEKKRREKTRGVSHSGRSKTHES